jgi:hypothetical protein
MVATKPVGLSAFKDILLAHEREFRASRGAERQEVVQEVMKEMVAESKGTLDKDFLKGLEQVSSPT